MPHEDATRCDGCCPTGLQKDVMDQFAGVLFVFLQFDACTFDVLMPEDDKEPVRTGSCDAASEKDADRAVAWKIGELLPRSEIFKPTLSPTACHRSCWPGAAPLRATVVANDLFQNAVLEAVLHSHSDLEYAGEPIQLKTGIHHRGESKQYNLHQAKLARSIVVRTSLASLWLSSRSAAHASTTSRRRTQRRSTWSVREPLFTFDCRIRTTAHATRRMSTSHSSIRHRRALKAAFSPSSGVQRACQCERDAEALYCVVLRCRRSTS
jgi:hypothetical protein